MIPIDPGAGNTSGGLWDLIFGSGGTGSPNTLYFTDGINGETAGLFGAITVVPEPSTWALMLAGLGGLGFAARRRGRPARAIV
ncbi:MAG TPA: PEPxxWA-CTERM sorting domain-containing protein [Roseiarcus sp.]|nr:PEPxxWA-CTERM sorting domain-containing protein [Roseiarcus sp.]